MKNSTSSSPGNLILFKGVTVHIVDFYYGFEFISYTKETEISNFKLGINFYFTFHTLIHSTSRFYAATFHQILDLNIFYSRDSISSLLLFYFAGKKTILEGKS